MVDFETLFDRVCKVVKVKQHTDLYNFFGISPKTRQHSITAWSWPAGLCRVQPLAW